MLDLMRSFSDTLHASFGEKFLNYTPDSRHFSEEFPDTPHASNSGEFLLLTHLMLVLVRWFLTHLIASLSEEILFKLHSVC